ncbi:hypothetical protein B9G98_01310 [Wickerhamiella sorbophila]|uniref:Uncharacterized protein n=1 Tax=Wickerhamiella sorbophila TaxID=45607 RepID=A0A2T0FFD6_9ASCO|nr:hypothetical protein B9G98_01310 [Wickerhamiella sorbophila]PRT53690.1 hypothetical protein B9G98_01310 [Wickerhamiella sorbophila]
MASDSVLNRSLDSLEKRLDILELSVKQQNSKHTLSHNVDALVRDVNELARSHPELTYGDQLLQKYGLVDIYTRKFADEKLYQLVQARIECLGSTIDQLLQLKTMDIPPIDHIACSPNPDQINSAVRAFEQASIRSVELLSRWLCAIQQANTAAGNLEATLKTAEKS